jgi:macrodomain Ter protein organizer (MatP/YcbG family)
MKNAKKVPVLVHTLSCRLEHDMFTRLLAAANRDRRTLSDYVRLLVEEHERQQEHAL